MPEIIFLCGAAGLSVSVQQIADQVAAAAQDAVLSETIDAEHLAEQGTLAVVPADHPDRPAGLPIVPAAAMLKASVLRLLVPASVQGMPLGWLVPVNPLMMHPRRRAIGAKMALVTLPPGQLKRFCRARRGRLYGVRPPRRH